MIKKVILFLLFLSFTLSFQAQGRFRILDNSKNSQNATFSLVNNLIVIPAEINGKKLNFLLDTGIKKTILFNFSSKILVV